MRPDLTSLALFVRIAELHSITKAANASHIALAAASRRITQLEDQYGVKLLYRTARGVELTPAGHALLGHARSLMSQVDTMRADLSEYTKQGKGLVRMQANASALAQYLPEDLAAFAATHPEVKISLGEERSGVITDALRTGATDVGVVMEGADTEGLQVLGYRADTLAVVVPRRHPLRGKPVAFQTLLDHDFVSLDSTTVISQILAGQAAAAGRPLRLRVQVKSFDVVARLVQAGLGIGVLPEAAIRGFASMGLRSVPLTDAWATRRMYVCVRHYVALTAPARALVDHLSAQPAGG